MSSQPPRRRPSPGVYRRRRLVVLLALIAIIAAIVWLFVAQPWSSAAQPDAGPKPTRTSSVSPTPSATTPAPTDSSAPEAAATTDPGPLETAPPTCTRGDVIVEALTDQDEYASGQNPQLSIRLTNTSDASCTINVGTTTQSFTITSGSDTWWRSTDCQTEPSDMIVTLEAGQTVESSTPLMWDRTRSSVSTCDSESRPAAGAGGASYHLAVEIGGIASDQTKQFFLY
ncbi:hypothetical protein [Microbacterium schleiferi]|uniref:hypothetical protein n=1 Tax=Microbacterium schleiferi TaxID=69362 RepID=UPI00311EB8F3